MLVCVIRGDATPEAYVHLRLGLQRMTHSVQETQTPFFRLGVLSYRVEGCGREVEGPAGLGVMQPQKPTRMAQHSMAPHSMPWYGMARHNTVASYIAQQKRLKQPLSALHCKYASSRCRNCLAQHDTAWHDTARYGMLHGKTHASLKQPKAV